MVDTQNIFLILLNKMLPLYIMIGVGVIAGIFLHMRKDMLSRLLIYIMSPIVVFYGTYTIDFHVKYLSLPIIFFVLSTTVSLVFLQLGKRVFHKDERKNLVAMGVGTGNTGYFGFPVVIALLGPKAFSIAVFMQMGVVLFESAVGVFLLARGTHSVRESIKRVVRIPVIYAFLLGIVLAGFNLSLGSSIEPILEDSFTYFRGAYSVLGMMIIGLGITACRFHSFDIRFLTVLLLGKTVVYPLLIAGLIMLDRSVFHMFDRLVYQVAVIMALVPLAANLVAYAVELKVFPDKAALAVVISTILAFFYIPFVINIVFF